MTTKGVKAAIGYGENPEGRPVNDFYRTPAVAVEKLLSVERFSKHSAILEPACGDGAISEILIGHNYDVISTDLYDYGYGMTGIDFLTYKGNYDSIITNPPFNQAEEFIQQGLKLTENYGGKVALLLRLSFLEGQKRKELFEKSPLHSVHVFSKRLSFTRPNEEVKGGGMMAYCWMVWDWSYRGTPRLSWI